MRSTRTSAHLPEAAQARRHSSARAWQSAIGFEKQGLQDLGLVEERETMSGSDVALARIPTLTLAGVDYPTG